MAAIEIFMYVLVTLVRHIDSSEICFPPSCTYCIEVDNFIYALLQLISSGVGRSKYASQCNLPRIATIKSLGNYERFKDRSYNRRCSDTNTASRMIRPPSFATHPFLGIPNSCRHSLRLAPPLHMQKQELTLRLLRKLQVLRQNKPNQHPFLRKQIPSALHPSPRTLSPKQSRLTARWAQSTAD